MLEGLTANNNLTINKLCHTLGEIEEKEKKCFFPKEAKGQFEN